MADANEQWIVEHRPQTVKRGTDGRLAEKQLLRHTRDVALKHQRFEHHHQVDVSLAQFIAIHSLPPFPNTAGSLERRDGGVYVRWLSIDRQGLQSEREFSLVLSYPELFRADGVGKLQLQTQHALTRYPLLHLGGEAHIDNVAIGLLKLGIQCRQAVDIDDNPLSRMTWR